MRILCGISGEYGATVAFCHFLFTMLFVMNMSRLQVSQLQQRLPDAWTTLLRTHEPLQEVEVCNVHVESVAGRPGFHRYLLTLRGHTDPVPFVGKQTNSVEARFYAELAEHVPSLTPRCWLSHAAAERSWLVLDEVPDHRPVARWTSDDVERIIGALVTFHATFWEMEDYLVTQEWLPRHLSRPGAGIHRGYYELMRDSSKYLGLGRAASISAHAIQTAGRLAPTFVRTAAGLELLRKLGGWPGIIEAEHLDAVAELLDDPLPMLQPLRELPVTLLHGNLAPRHWRLTLFNERYLLDWHHATAGPAVCDLVDFLEQTQRLWWQERRAVDGEPCPVTEETMVDSYLLRMSMLLGSEFSARAMRQAIPAALCLHVLMTWLPRFAIWFQSYANSPYTWEAVAGLADEHLQTAGLGHLAGMRDYLADLFQRFLLASKSL